MLIKQELKKENVSTYQARNLNFYTRKSVGISVGFSR
jgi:hypothetical protein